MKNETPDGGLEEDLGMVVTREAFPDIWFDDNVIPASLIKELDDAGSFVPVHNFANPLVVAMAVQGDGMKLQISQKAKLTTEFKLKVGPLRLRNVLWLVSDN